MAQVMQASARSSSNIAFIKYWGNTDSALRIAATPSLSMNLADLYTIATVRFNPELEQDNLTINGNSSSPEAAKRVFAHLDLIRNQAKLQTRAYVETQSNFPAGAGIASSAAAFSALAVAGAAAAGLTLSEAELSRLARRGSGSACRSIPGGYCQWRAGGIDKTSYATSIAPADHWDLVDIIAVVSTEHKQVGSTQGHSLAETSLFQAARIASAAERFEKCKTALLEKDLYKLGPVIEEDTIIMHSVMMTGRPPLFYWLPATLAIITAVQEWRDQGLAVYYTIDAGPNVHLICESQNADQVENAVGQIPEVKETYRSGPGGPARLV